MAGGIPPGLSLEGLATRASPNNQLGANLKVTPLAAIHGATQSAGTLDLPLLPLERGEALRAYEANPVGHGSKKEGRGLPDLLGRTAFTPSASTSLTF
jgi:hypothetical protein